MRLLPGRGRIDRTRTSDAEDGLEDHGDLALLGVDIGTTHVKACACDEDGSVVRRTLCARAKASLDQSGQYWERRWSRGAGAGLRPEHCFHKRQWYAPPDIM